MAKAANVPRNDDFNRGNNEGVGYFQVNQKNGLRWTTAKAFLKPVADRPNLRVVTHAQGTRLIWEGRRAAGLEFSHRGQPACVRADGEVILAAGSLGSTQLLQLSGVGPADHLKDHGIDVHHELPGAGANLQDHLQVRTVFKVANTRTLNLRANSLIGRAGMALQYGLFRRGPLTMAPSQLGCFAKSDPSYETPNLEYHIQPLSCDKLGDPLHPFEAFTASVCNLRPESRGSVRLRSADPLDAPVIKPNYLSAPADRKVAADAIRLTRHICAAPALSRFEPAEFLPGTEVASDEDLARAAGDIGTTIFHPVGTCKMGDDPLAVVDDRLRVHGLQGVRVIDASVMPTITSGNTAAPTMMIAEKGAEMVLQDARKGA
jgi:choline dehydrogenase